MARKSGNVTLKEVAKAVGVSIASVSLVLNKQDHGRVKPEIAAKIRETAHSMGYIPNTLAQSLRTHKTRIIGFISDDIATSPHAGRVILGAQDAAQQAGYMLIMLNTNGSGTIDSSQILPFQQFGIEGFLYAHMFNRSVAIPEVLQEFPTVVLDGSDPESKHAGVYPDEQLIGYDATNRLIADGYRRIAYLGTAAGGERAQKGRFAGYQKALANADIEFDATLVSNASGAKSVQRAVQEIFASPHGQPDAFFIFNDTRAVAVYEAAAEYGLSVGKNFGVIGVDNHPLIQEALTPNLTSIELPHYEMGWWGVMQLLEVLDPAHAHQHFAELPNTTVKIPPIIPADKLTNLDGNADSLALDTAIHCAIIDNESA